VPDRPPYQERVRERSLGKPVNVLRRNPVQGRVPR
jgi:hypothetical protein